MKDIDVQTGIIETFSKDNLTGKITIHKEQDVQPFIKANERALAAQTTGFKGNWHKMASIPPIVIEMWREELKARGDCDPNPLAATNKKFLLGKLNSPEWNKLRTKQGVI